MAMGPGKYDELATYVREKSEADAVIVIVRGGNQGDSFCVQANRPDFVVKLPRLLREMADQLELPARRDHRELQQKSTKGK